MQGQASKQFLKLFRIFGMFEHFAGMSQFVNQNIYIGISFE